MSIRDRLRAMLEEKLRVPSMPAALSRLQESGLRPPMVIDIGAYRGDFASLALEKWPAARVLCVEALPKMAAIIQARFENDARIRVLQAVLGATDGEVVHLHEAETATSVLDEHVEQAFPVSEHRTVCLDSLLVDSTEGFDGCLIKIDVQGYELNVLKGAERMLAGAAALVVELNLLDIHRGVPLFHEVIGWLAQRGWVAYDVAGITRRPLDGAAWQVDLSFVPEQSPLRSDKRWSASA